MPRRVTWHFSKVRPPDRPQVMRRRTRPGEGDARAALLASYDIESTVCAVGRADLILAASGLAEAEDEMIAGQEQIRSPQGVDTEGRVEKNAAKNHARSSPARVAAFGPFCLYTAERVLERDGRRLKIGGSSLNLSLGTVNDPGVLSTLARSLWRRGFPDQAMAKNEEGQCGDGS